jgi:hypothetical protein
MEIAVHLHRRDLCRHAEDALLSGIDIDNTIAIQSVPGDLKKGRRVVNMRCTHVVSKPARLFSNAGLQIRQHIRDWRGNWSYKKMRLINQI